MLLQSRLAGQKTGVDIGAAGNPALYGRFYGVIACGQIKPVGFVGITLKLYDTHLHGCAAVCGGVLQIIQKGEGFILHIFIGGRGAIQHEYYLRLQLFLCTGQGERYI